MQRERIAPRADWRERVEELYRTDSRAILATLIRLLGGFDVAEEALHDAFRTALEQWSRTGVPDNPRAWLLQIVRNTCYTWLQRNRVTEELGEFDDELYVPATPTPETLAIAGNDRERLRQALESLPARYREMIVLRELEGCSYKEIAAIASMPIGSVMSALSRARRQLQVALAGPERKEAARGL